MEPNDCGGAAARKLRDGVLDGTHFGRAVMPPNELVESWELTTDSSGKRDIFY